MSSATIPPRWSPPRRKTTSPAGAAQAPSTAIAPTRSGRSPPRLPLVDLEEVVVHSWDVAKATGHDPTIDPAVIQMVYGFCRSIPLDAFRATSAFGAEVTVPESASANDRVVALLARRP
jgi:uncharacterized protein (TIGR03086 family)